MDEVLCLGGLTALEYWRQVRMRVAAANVPGEYEAAKPPLLVRLLFEDDPLLDLAAMPEASALTAAPATLDSALAAEGVRACVDLSAPLSCYVRNSAGRRYCAGVNTVTLGGEFPPGSFVWDARGFAVPAPELLALLLGRALSAGRLLMVLSELCGLYALGAAGMAAVPPLTTCEKIRRTPASWPPCAVPWASACPGGRPPCWGFCRTLRNGRRLLPRWRSRFC